MNNSLEIKLRTARVDLCGVSGIGRFLSALVLVALLCCALTEFAVWAYHGGRSKDTAGVDPPKMVVSAQPMVSSSGAKPIVQQSARVEAEVITIRPTGFEPREITRPKGLFLLAVENRSGLQTIQLRLDREVGPRLRDVQMPRNRHDWKDAFDLTPGRYVLTEAYHPEWVCNITITSK